MLSNIIDRSPKIEKKFTMSKAVLSIFAIFIASVGSPMPQNVKEFSSLLLCLMFLDTLTGLLGASVLREVQSRKFTEMLARKMLTYTIICSLGLAISMMFDSWFFFNSVILALCCAEAVSMLETARKLQLKGHKIPYIDKIISFLGKIFDDALKNSLSANAITKEEPKNEHTKNLETGDTKEEKT